MNVLRVLSTELRQVFRAYTRQLKPTDSKDEKGSEARHMQKGFEQVSLSEQAMKLSSSGQNEQKETPPDAT
ncbi:MAG: hypothetical protein JXX14_12995 [Deltaproteobacteria bacterium]|nr:hypothetical protein [Deltaproteobacteria bacterium]